VHTFASAGSYLVRLTISGLGGTDQKAVSLSVDAPYWTVYLPNIHKILWPAIVKDDYELYE
jgi:PKD repeat protein